MKLKIWIEVAGWLAAALILAAYALLSLGKLEPRSRTYQWMNVAGALGFIVNSGWNGAWPSVGLNVVWLGIAWHALARLRRP